MHQYINLIQTYSQGIKIAIDYTFTKIIKYII